MAAIGGFRPDLSITRKTDGNFGHVSSKDAFYGGTQIINITEVLMNIKADDFRRQFFNSFHSSV